jgi:hypothetical protein
MEIPEGSEPDEAALPDHDETVTDFLFEIGAAPGDRHADPRQFAIFVPHPRLDMEVVDISPFGVEYVEEDAFLLRDGRCLDPKPAVDDVEGINVRQEL